MLQGMYKCSYTHDKRRERKKERTDDKCLWWRSNILYKLDSSVDCHLLTERYSIWWMMSQQQYNACTHNLLCLLTERLDDIQIAQLIDMCVLLAFMPLIRSTTVFGIDIYMYEKKDEPIAFITSTQWYVWRCMHTCCCVYTYRLQ